MNRIKKLARTLGLTSLNETIFVATISLVTAVFNIFHVIVGAAKTPQGSVYLWIGHYYFDYFEYIQQIAQGIRGRWLVENPYTPFDSTKTLLGWGQYLILGKIAAIFHISAIAIYWLSIFVYTLILCVLIYTLIKHLLKNSPFYVHASAFVLCLFAAPFSQIKQINGVITLVPFIFWYGPMHLLQRFGHVPHHVLSVLLSAVLIMIISDTLENISRLHSRLLIARTIIIILILYFFMTFVPFQVINLMFALALTGGIIFVRILLLKDKRFSIKKIFAFISSIFILLLPISYVIQMSHKSSELFKRAVAWEITQQFHPPLSQILLVTGPIAIFMVFGLKKYFKDFSLIRIFFFLYIFSSYFFFTTPFALYVGTFNLRFLTPLSYVLFAVLAMLGIQQIAFWFRLKEKLLTVVVLILLLPYFVFCNVLDLKTTIESSKYVEVCNYFTKEIMDGLYFINKLPHPKVVLTSPRQVFGAILPIFADKKVYIGRTMFTPDLDNRLTISSRFYEGLSSPEEVRLLIKNNNIGYVLLTYLDGYSPEVIKNYDMFKPIFNNKQVIVYEVIE